MMIVFDLDGTLADCEHRRHLVDPKKHPEYFPAPGYHMRFSTGILSSFDQYYKRSPESDTGFVKFKPDWKGFYEACSEDVPIWPVVRVIESFCLNNVTLKDAEIQIWSGRCESVRDRTAHWLKYIIGDYTYSQLKMRPIGNSTPDDELKEKWLDESIAAGHKIDFVFDDRPKVVRMWRRRGIFVFNCSQSDEEF